MCRAAGFCRAHDIKRLHLAELCSKSRIGAEVSFPLCHVAVYSTLVESVFLLEPTPTFPFLHWKNMLVAFAFKRYKFCSNQFTYYLLIDLFIVLAAWSGVILTLLSLLLLKVYTSNNGSHAKTVTDYSLVVLQLKEKKTNYSIERIKAVKNYTDARARSHVSSIQTILSQVP